MKYRWVLLSSSICSSRGADTYHTAPATPRIGHAAERAGASATGGSRQRDLRREIAHDFRGRAVGLQHGARPAAVGRVVAVRRERQHVVWLAVAKARDLAHPHAWPSSAIDDA